MKVTWKNKKKKPLSLFTELPFEHDTDQPNSHTTEHDSDGTPLRSPNSDQSTQLSMQFQAQGDNLAMEGKYREALGKWEAALTLAPDVPALHEQKAQVLLEIGEPWTALKAATRATELKPSWAEAWVTLGRAQLNYGEPDNAIESFDRALALKPDFEEAQDDRKAASRLVKKRKQLHSSGLSATQNRYTVGDKNESS
ncbi:uncharacterized protein LOC127092619 [Lathyrus oleraceus]|uniref:Tetratricopeptide repeat protein 33 n=1 Tax=Pisum sativum TaxID=3888 RepID=A0A9D4W3C4_PEA|nr:uncharacterized protein LOC127092619 [Pisum sativum]KAI5394362.1 hypothetical protein KIW84_061155 [Pisum sativum]